MKRSLSWLIVSTFVAASCASGGRSVPEPTNMDAARWRGDPRLYQILLPYPVTEVERDSLRAYEAQYPTAFNDLLAEAATDDAAPTPVRVNALFLLAQRRVDTHMQTFRQALDAEDVRVRATAAAAMREFAQTYPAEALRIARMALFDPEPEVQAQALQIIGDSDPELLREYVERTAGTELSTVARDLVRLAEQRGAPLRRDSATGVLQRETPSGWRITFMPERRWPQWDAAYGSVRLEHEGAAPQTIDGVEAVAGVIPVFLSPDGRHVVFERDRMIVVRTLASGAERLLGSGIAPRLRPFTDEFVFLRERTGSAEEQREKTRIAYEVFVAAFDAPETVHPRLLGSTTATMSFGIHGSYSPARWMRVEERVGNFYLTAPDMEMVTLPDPFVSN